MNENEIEQNCDKEVYSFKKVINNFFSNIDIKEIEKGQNLSNIWEEIISKIYNYGPKLIGHTKIIDLKNGILLIETDHPGWNQILQNNKNFILTGLKRAIKDVQIKTLAFRVKGKEFSIVDDYEKIEKKEQEKVIEQIQKDEQKLAKMGFKTKVNTEIPEDVKKLFSEVL